MTTKHIVLISSGQPSTNPRLVKEADCLTAHGYRVTVLYAYWDKWASITDTALFKTRTWNRILVGGSRDADLISYFFSKALHVVCRTLVNKKPESRLKIYAVARATYPLIKAAKRIKADLYIAHNLGALPAAVLAAKANNSLPGFDAEDYHRLETTRDENNWEFRLKKAIEDCYIPQLKYFSVSSPLIQELYHKHYHSSATIIKNVFPKLNGKNLNGAIHQPLRIFWFSQTIGPNRGLEILVSALKYIDPSAYELHLLGKLKPGFLEELKSASTGACVFDNNIYFHAPIAPDELFKFTSIFDIGVASEPAFCTNNDCALSNKVFTYLQCGLALLLSDTTAQAELYKMYPMMGNLYKKDCPMQLAASIQFYIDNRDKLLATKKHNHWLGQHIFNWELESKHFLQLIDKTLNE